MRREDMERLAFLYLCEEKDRNILLGKRKMHLQDFLKFEYWTKKLELWKYNKSLWERYGGEFSQELGGLGDLKVMCQEEQEDRERTELEQLEAWERELECTLEKQNIEYM